MLKILQPPGWAEPKGYANGVAARGAFVAIGGQIGWNAAQAFETDDFAAQARQALANIVAVLAEAGARPEHVIRMTCYVTDLDTYRASLPDIGAAWKRHFGRHYPAMALVCVAGLLEEGAMVEIEATAAVPPATSSA